MATEDTKQVDNLEVIENADGSVVVREPGAAPAAGAADDAEDDRAPVHGVGREDQDDGPTEQEELAAAVDDAAREAVRARRRAERKSKRAAQQERERQLNARLQQADRANAELRERLNVIERKTSGSELAQLDGAIANAEAAVETYKGLMGEAANRSDGAASAEATEKLLIAREQVRDLKHIRQRMANPPQTRAPAPDPELVRHATDWMSKNKWYDPRGNDEDSGIVLVLDKTLANEGFAPNMPAYWDELSKRVARRLPHRARASDSGNGDILSDDAQPGDKKPARSVVSGSGREAAGNGGRGTEFTLSPARVQALKDAGMWEDPVKRNEMIRDYREFDKKNSSKS